MTNNHHIEELIEEKVKQVSYGNSKYENGIVYLGNDCLMKAEDYWRSTLKELTDIAYSQGLADGAAKERARVKDILLLRIKNARQQKQIDTELFYLRLFEFLVPQENIENLTPPE